MSKTLLTLEVRVFIVSFMLEDADPQGIPAQPPAHNPQASATEATSDSCCYQEYQSPIAASQSPPVTMPENGEGGENMTALIDLLARLSPAKQRLVRELIFSLAQLERLTIPEDHDARLDYHAHVDPWLQAMVARGTSPNTIRVYKRSVIALLSKHRHPTSAHLDASLAALVTAGRSPSTVCSAIDAVRSFFGYLADRSVISANPSARLQRPQRHDQMRRPPTTEQVRRLFSACTNLKYQLMLLLLCDCGLRVSELASLKLNQICKDTIVVIGKGKKARQVPISEQTATALSHQTVELEATGYPGPWLFPGRDPQLHITADSIRDYLTYLSRKADIPKITPHQLRHYFATSTLSLGASLKVISSILGHARTSTTVNTYWHIVEQAEVKQQHARFSPLALLKGEK